MLSNKESNSNSPIPSIRVNITTEKLDKKFNNDLKKLEKVSSNIPKLSDIKNKQPYKVNLDLNKQDKTVNTQEAKKLIPSHKYPFLKDEYVSVDELRSRVYHGTLGVVPVRKSQEIDQLKFIMKGKPIQKVVDSLYDEQLESELDDEGINEPNSSEEDEYDLRSAQNTPHFEWENQMANRNFYLYQQHQSKPKPAILPSTGTSGQAKMVQRPKPSKKEKTVLKQKRLITKTNLEDPSDLANLTETEKQQIELENEVKNLVNEAKLITNYKENKFKKLKNIPNTESNMNLDLKSDSPEFEPNNKKKLLKSVEGLISSIKSGQILIEQEQSNKRIQDILGTVFDKASLSLFDPSFSEHDKSAEHDLNLENESQTDSAIMVNEQSVLETTERNEADTQSKKSSVYLSDQQSLNESQAKSSIIQDQMQESARSFASSYQNEIDLYLASLPETATREDVFNTTAKKVKLFEKEFSKQDKKEAKNIKAEDKYARNLHLFCMLEQERRNCLLLPEELVDVTRKFHTRSKYDFKKTSNLNKPIDSLATINSAVSKFNESFLTYNRTDQAAKRVMENLSDLVNIETSEKQSESQIRTDSGLGDELNSWRQQAEEALVIEAKKMSLIKIDSMRDFSLTFLKPAPPKMSIRPSKIRESLFQDYKSMPPPADELNLLKNKTTKSKKYLEFTYQRDEELDSEENSNIEDEDDSEVVEDSDLEFQFILDKMLSREYQSETELDKLEYEQDDLFKNNQKLPRSLSDTCITRNRIPDYEFLKIDSNYNDAMDEVLNQKRAIKNDFNSKKRLTQSNLMLNSSTNKFKTPDYDDEIKKIENISSSGTLSQENHTRLEFFPKNVQKSLAEEALEQGRNYIINNSKSVKDKNVKKLIKQEKRKYENKKPKLGLELLEQVEKEILSKNVQILKKSESMNKIDFKPKLYHPDDIRLNLASRVKFERRSSVDNLVSFEKYKSEKGFNKSKWFHEKDNFYDKEREWVRDIWNVWFDQIIPRLDGTFERDDDLDEEKSMMIKKQKPQQNLTNQQETVVEEEEEEEPEDDYDDERGIRIKRLVKSPTPYSNYGQINIEDFDPNYKIDPKQLKLVETEIEVLDKRLETNLNIFDLVRRGTLYRKLGFIKKALQDINLAIDHESKYVDAYWQRHLIYLVQDKKKEALEDLNLIIKLNKSHAGAYLSRGDLFAERNDTAMAIVNYSQTIKYNPKDYQAYFRRAKMYELRGDVRMAMDDYLTTTKLNPKIAEAWFKHGMSYYNSDNWHYAIVDFTELIKHNPTEQAQARLYRGKCYLKLEDHQQAFDDFCVAIHLNPNDWESYYNRACLLRKIDPRQALKDYSISLMIEDGNDNLKSYLHRAILYTDLEMYDEAIKDFESVLQLDKEYAPAYVNLGIIYMNLTLNYWKAIKNFNLAIKANPIYIRAYLCRAQAYRYIHDLKKAYLDYTKAIHLDPMNTQIYIYRGQVILEMGNLELAAFCVQHASFLNDNLRTKSSIGDEQGTTVRSVSAKSKIQSESVYNLNSQSSMSIGTQVSSKSNQSVTQKALVFSFLKNYDKAINVLEQELKVKANTDIYNLLGRVYMKAKRWTDAVNTFEKSIEINFDDSKSQNKSSISQSFSKLNNIAGFKSSKKDLIDACFMKGQCLIELFKYHEAYTAFDKVLDLDANNSQAFYYRGITRVHLGHQKCIQDFNKSLALNPNLFEAFLARACIYAMQNRFTKAILNCNQAVKLNSKSVRGYLYRGALKYLSKSFEYAIDDLTQAIKLDQTCALGFFNRALCYQQLKQYRLALKDFSIVLMLGEYLNFRVYINRGLLYFSLKNYTNSLIDFKMASKYSENDYNIQHMIGVCLHKLERYNEAIEKLTETYNINPSLHDALISRGNVYVDYGNENSFQKAMYDYKTVLDKDSNNLDAHINLAYLYQITSRFKLAWEQFSTAIKINPNYVPAYEGRAVVCLQMSDCLAALKDINQAIKIKPSAELFVNRGVINQFMADNVNAMRDYQSAILINTEYGLAYYNSANILLIHRQYGQAVKNLDIAIDKCDMKDESTYQNRAIAKALNGDTVGAFRDLCEAIKYGKFTAHIFMNRGLLLYKMENYKLAQNDFTTAINLSPNDALLYKLRADCKGKLGLKEEAINDYKLAVDLQQREELRKRLIKK